MGRWYGSSGRTGLSGFGPGYEAKGEFKLRVHNHDEHQFEPSPVVPEKPQASTRPRKQRKVPVAAPMLMVANIVVFVLMMYSNNCPKSIEPGRKCVGTRLKALSFQPWSENPILGPRRSELLKWGGVESRHVVKSGEGWRLVSAVAVTGGVLQLLVNLVAILVVGLRLELVFSSSKVFIIYVASGFGGSMLSALVIQGQVFAGASGAVMGLVGASVADIVTNWDITERKLEAGVTLFLVGLVSVVFGLMPQVDNFANVGGFITGILLGFALLMRPQKGFKDTRHLSQLEAFMAIGEDVDTPLVKKHKKSQRVLQVVAVILLLVLLLAGCVALFTDHTAGRRCSWCHYLACVPNLKWTCPGTYV